MQVSARHPLMADMQHVSQQVAPEARPPRNDNLHCANIATFVPPNKHKVRHLSVFFLNTETSTTHRKIHKHWNDVKTTL